MKLFICFCIFAFIFTLLLSFEAKAQQTIFNVPTSDVLDKGKIYVELDAAFKVDQRWQFGRFSGLVPRVVIGTGRKVEVGLNIIGNIQPGSDSTVLVPTAKWKFFENKKKDLAFFGGADIYTSPSEIVATTSAITAILLRAKR